jgi:hypothetical protein
MDWNDYTTEQLATRFWDYHKDVHGVRPHWVDHTDRVALISGLESLDLHMATLKSTPEGRERLRNDGWYVEQEDY